jgi:hypothetical protein
LLIAIWALFLGPVSPMVAADSFLRHISYWFGCCRERKIQSSPLALPSTFGSTVRLTRIERPILIGSHR